MKQNQLLKGLKVVELAGVLAGPSAGLFFAELGAEVIKIENPLTGGDVTRTWKSKNEKTKDNFSAYFASINFYKKHLFLNLTDEKDRIRLLKIIAKSDVVISNFKKGDDKKFGLDFKSLKKLNPQLINVALSGFGENSSRTAYDLIVQAESGFMSMNGTEKSGPIKMPVALIDLLAGHQIKEAILLSLIKREKSKKGSKINVSLMDVAICSLVNQSANYLIGGTVPKRMGSLHPNIAPYGEIFTTKDNQQITFAIGNDRQFIDLCSVLKLNQIPGKSEFKDNQARVSNRVKLAEVLQKKIKEINCKKLYNNALDLNIPVGKIKNIDEVLNSEGAKELIKTPFVNQNLKVVSGNAFFIE